MRIDAPWYKVQKAPGDGQFGATLKEGRVGVMIHYDASASDAGGLAWFADPGCTVSYQDLVTDDGVVHEIAPRDARAWHAGVCKPSEPRLKYTDANSAFYGLSAATNDKVQATVQQLLSMAARTRWYFALHNWPVTDTWRIVGHDSEAWPRGRKSDPHGASRERPILSVQAVRTLMPLISL